MHFEVLDGALRGVVVMDVGRDKITFTVPFLNYHASIIGTGIFFSDLERVVGINAVLFLA